jgi:hypothetical protein
MHGVVFYPNFSNAMKDEVVSPGYAKPLKKSVSFSEIMLALIVGLPVATASEKLGFNQDIRPILSDHCFTCHGQDSGARKGELRLDVREGALKGGKSGDPALVPGKPDESPFLARLLTHDPTELMPPPKAKNPVSPKEIETLRKWIGEGAEYQPHWAFIPPQRPEGVGEKAIDTLVRARLAANGLKPSPEATPETLCRRLWLDLTGLPPSPQELDVFLSAWAKDKESAYTGLVEKLLASPSYGEKWARHWLDVARYADSDGYEKDLPRQQWAWRDWVIHALNEDMPYDRFIVEQIAGDLLPMATQDDIVATGYLRNSMVSEEGAIVAEQYRKEGMFDRMDALGKGVLGLTVQCTQCHTHKFDPITHDEYYSMFAFLNDTYEATSRVYSPEKLAVIGEIKKGVKVAEERLKSAHSDWPQSVGEWGGGVQAQSAPWEVITPTAPEWGGGLVHPEVLPDGSVLSLGFRGSNGDLSFTPTPKLAGVNALRIEALTHGDLIFGGPGRNPNGLFALSELTVEVMPPGSTEWKKVALGKTTADFESPAGPIAELYRKDDKDKRTVGPAAFLTDNNRDTAWSPDRGPGRRNAPVEAVVTFAESLNFPDGTKLRCSLNFSHAGKDTHGRQSQILGRFRVALASGSVPAPLPAAARLALATPADRRTPEENAAIFSAWRATVTEFSETNEEIEKLWARFPEADTSVLHLAERKPADVRKTFLLDRGAWDQPKHEVKPGTPAFLPPLAVSDEPPRLSFARWLVDRRSPTAARVAVNRVWQALFGHGLNETPEDLGVRAAPPAQPKLFDWLAVEFMDRGWSQKQLIREIVSSATYRQSSHVSPELLDKDPRNRLLARGPRFRAEAEVIRDIALQTSGLLTTKIGGPGFFPPMPQSVLSSSFIEVDFWKTASAPERYRRSLYVFRRRSMPDPALGSFDAPNGDTACAGRVRSNSPLAALASLNEPVFAEAARALALRVLREGGSDDAARAAYAFRLCTCRTALPAEVDEIVGLLQSRRTRLADGSLSATQIASGDSGKLPELPPGITPEDAAAWTITARVLLNLDETLTKN